MKIIGITGQTGAGKSVICEILTDRYGYYQLDADKVAKLVIDKDKRLLKRLAEIFGDDIILSDGSLDRRLLAERAFSSKENTERLDEAVYPAVAKQAEKIIKKKQDENYNGILLDAIGLFESSLDRLCDFTVAVTAPPETRRERIILRDGLTASQAQSRINAQKDESFFKENADLIIDNSGKESLDGLVQRILNYEKE
ncbi:MAG: dephospho-CoA kinase [Clostridia bacterium]|nr:dephospho-CoA kinase [Clostridia bacterium]